MYRILLAQKARKFYAKAELSLAKKIARCFQILEQEPRKHSNIKPLKGKLQGRYRYRMGDYRVIYKIDDQKAQVIILAIAHRSQIYE